MEEEDFEYQPDASLTIIFILKLDCPSKPYLVFIEPADDLVTLVQNLPFVLVADLALQLLVFHSRLHVEGVGLQTVLGSHLLSLDIVLSLVLLCFLDHTLNVPLAQAT